MKKIARINTTPRVIRACICILRAILQVTPRVPPTCIIITDVTYLALVHQPFRCARQRSVQGETPHKLTEQGVRTDKDKKKVPQWQSTKVPKYQSGKCFNVSMFQSVDVYHIMCTTQVSTQVPHTSTTQVPHKYHTSTTQVPHKYHTSTTQAP